ncbi:MAG: RsmG family class I SAM-dependent methyltransferase [Ferrimicrobium sp.]
MMMERLQESIHKAQAWGFIGGDIDLHLDHSHAFVEVLQSLGFAEESGVDLGSGGGLPSLILLSELPSIRLTLVEVMIKRANFLETTIDEAGFGERAHVVIRRAEELAHDAEHRERYGFVTARSFASPAVTAEVATGFLRPGGKVIVSEPPESTGERWPADGLALLGLSLSQVYQGRYSFAVLAKSHACDRRYPRRAGKAWKQPLF